ARLSESLDFAPIHWIQCVCQMEKTEIKMDVVQNCTLISPNASGSVRNSGISFFIRSKIGRNEYPPVNRLVIQNPTKKDTNNMSAPCKAFVTPMALNPLLNK